MAPKDEYSYYSGVALPLLRDYLCLPSLKDAASSRWGEKIILGYRFSFYPNPKAMQQPEVLRPLTNVTQ